MPPISEVQLREIRHRYNAAYTGYQSCVIALNQAAAGNVSETLLENEEKALRELTDARANLLAAIRELAGGHPADA
jgi:hypothetical protein